LRKCCKSGASCPVVLMEVFIEYARPDQEYLNTMR
jgi:hypothetical protein